MNIIQNTDNSFLKPRDAWNALSMREQAEMMKVAVRNGIYDLATIRQKYNEFAEGGNTNNDNYYSQMEKVAEENYKRWGFNSPNEALVHALNDNTYNYKDYYKENPASTANADTHWPDTYKTVYHPTFSEDSKYSGQKSQYNPQGLPGGFWSKESFVPMAWQINAAENRFTMGGNTESEDNGYWEKRREHAPIKPMYKRTQKDDEYWAAKQKRNDEAAARFNAKTDNVMSQLEKAATSQPMTGDAYLEAANDQREKTLDKWNDYKKGINATITAAELGLSGASLLGAYANWKNWANATNLTKQTIANLLQKAQAPMQVGGTLIDSYQTYDAATKGEDFNKWYNAASTLLGSAGYVGALDTFRGVYPMADRFLDTSGIIQNAGDYVKFGYDTVTANNHLIGGPLVEAAMNEYMSGGGIHIAPSKKGTFTAAASKHGMGVQEFASKVLAHRENYSPAMVKKANFARNAKKFKHSLGGPLVENLFYTQNENLYGFGDWLNKAKNVVKKLGLDKSPSQHFIEWISPKREVDPDARNLEAVLQHKKKHSVKDRSWYFDTQNNKGYRLEGDKIAQEFEIASGLNTTSDGYTPLAKTNKGETDYSLNRNLMSTGAGIFTLSRKYDKYGEPMYMMREGRGDTEGYSYEKDSKRTGIQTNQTFHAPASENRTALIGNNIKEDNKVSFGCIYPSKEMLKNWTEQGLIAPGDTVYIEPKLSGNYLHYDPTIGRIVTHYSNAPTTVEGKNYSSKYKLNNVKYNKGY